MSYSGHEHIAIIFFIHYFIIFSNGLFLSNVPEFSRFFIVLKIIFIYFTILNIIFFIIGICSYFIFSVNYQEVLCSIKSLGISWIFNYSFIFIFMSELDQMWQEIINYEFNKNPFLTYNKQRPSDITFDMIKKNSSNCLWIFSYFWTRTKNIL